MKSFEQHILQHSVPLAHVGGARQSRGGFLFGGHMSGTNEHHSTCFHCGRSLSEEKIRRRSKYCSQRCAVVNRRGMPPPSITRHLPSSDSGAFGELAVSADLILRGYNVFRSVSPCAPCDLIMLESGSPYRVEVTTGYMSKRGKLTYPTKDHAKFDILAVIVPGEICYLCPPEGIGAKIVERLSQRRLPLLSNGIMLQ